MSTMTIRGIDEHLKTALRHRAAEHGRSMEAEVRAILHEALGDTDEPQTGAELVRRIRARFAPYGGVDLDIPPRTDEPREVDFG